MESDEIDALMEFLMVLGSAQAETSQKVNAVVNALESGRPYTKELQKLKERGGSTNIPLALEALHAKLFAHRG